MTEEERTTAEPGHYTLDTDHARDSVGARRVMRRLIAKIVDELGETATPKEELVDDVMRMVLNKQLDLAVLVSESHNTYHFDPGPQFAEIADEFAEDFGFTPFDPDQN